MHILNEHDYYMVEEKIDKRLEESGELYKQRGLLNGELRSVNEPSKQAEIKIKIDLIEEKLTKLK